MAITVVRIYDNFAAAEQARSELLRSGFDEDCVQLTTKVDEAGPVQGSFILPGKDGSPTEERGFFGNLFSGGEPGSRSRRNRRPEIIHCGVYLLTVDAGDDMQYDRAADIMHRFGAVDVEQRVATTLRGRP
jgi:hypothetical protein